MDLSAGVELCADAVARAVEAGATDVEVRHSSRELFEVNLDGTEIGLIRTTVSDDLAIAVYVDGRKGTSAINGRSRDDVDRAVAEAVRAAQSDEPDAANVIATGDPSPLREIGDTEPDREAMLDAASRFIRALAAEYPKVRCGESVYSFSNGWRSFANSAGVTRQERRAGYQVMGLFTGKDGDKTTSMNYSYAVSATPFAELLDVGMFRTILDETVRSFDPKPVPETFVGDVLFTPGSLDTLIDPVANALGGMAILRGTSVFADSLGDAIASPAFTLTSTPNDPRFPMAEGFDAHGIPATDLDVVVDGELRNHLIGWYTSKKLDRPMTTGSTAFAVAPGDQSYDDLIAGIERGIVLGRFSGGSPNENLDFSGVAKNSFYVEDGRIVGPIAETMVAGNFRDLLKNVRAVGDQAVNTGMTAYPYVLTSGATISGK